MSKALNLERMRCFFQLSQKKLGIALALPIEILALLYIDAELHILNYRYIESSSC